MTPTNRDHKKIQQCLSDCSLDLAFLWQNNLLNKTLFMWFAKNRDLTVSGPVSGNLDHLHKRGWLHGDGIDSYGEPLFHPFRFYVVQKILDRCKLRILPSDPLNRNLVADLVQHSVKSLPTEDEFGEFVERIMEIVDLAVLLEPIYWSDITSWQSRRLIADGQYLSEEEFDARLAEYQNKASVLVANLDPKYWADKHKRMRVDAALLDNNRELYVLVRLADWKQREKLNGSFSAALWIRHMAEVIRRAFEEIHRVQWPEEDEAFGVWLPGGRKLVFGFDRPLDHRPEARSYAAVNFGLFTGSAARWYVEGTTEYYTILEILRDPAKFGLEMLNLRGNIASERDNAALRLGEWLLEDRTQRRFSIISFDTDVPANVKAIQRQVKERRIVGFIGAHSPDFEFANFAIEELVEIAARFDESHGVHGNPVRSADWNGAVKMREFETKYKEVSELSPASLKGEEWGRALGRYAMRFPTRSDKGIKRPFWEALEKAIRCRGANYDLEAEYWEFDPGTFQVMPRK